MKASFWFWFCEVWSSAAVTTILGATEAISSERGREMREMAKFEL